VTAIFQVFMCCKYTATATCSLRCTSLTFLATAATLVQEADLIRLKREAKALNGFYVEPEAKLLFVIRIRGINDMHPKVSPQPQPPSTLLPVGVNWPPEGPLDRNSAFL
jgi:hypothetical protein